MNSRRSKVIFYLIATMFFIVANAILATELTLVFYYCTLFLSGWNLSAWHFELIADIPR